MKRIVTIQDISCIGRCSLTVALPILSSMGVEACVLPTAVLSGHTAFPSFSFHDLTEEIPKISAVWEQQKLCFDAIYSGYLGSVRQIRMMLDFYTRFGEQGVLKIADPAMADAGKLYQGFDDKFAQAMKELCGKADIIVPNLTEGCILSGTPWREDTDAAFCEEIAAKLGTLGAGRVVLTGFSTGKDNIGALAYDSATGESFCCLNERYPVSFHGTGDIFASVLSGALTRGMAYRDAVQLAVDFDHDCIGKTLEDPDHRWYGVNFEQALPGLIRRMQDSVILKSVEKV